MKIFKAFKWYFRIKNKLNDKIGDKYYKRYGGWYWNGSKDKLIQRLNQLVKLEDENRRQLNAWGRLYNSHKPLVELVTQLEEENAKLKARLTELKNTRYM